MHVRIMYRYDYIYGWGMEIAVCLDSLYMWYNIWIVDGYGSGYG